MNVSHVDTAGVVQRIARAEPATQRERDAFVFWLAMNVQLPFTLCYVDQ